MVAKIKILKNQAEIEAAQKKAEQWMRENQDGDISDRPAIPDAEFTTTDLLLDVNHISLAYRNASGGINVDYKDKSFVLVNDEGVWGEIAASFESRVPPIEKLD